MTDADRTRWANLLWQTIALVDKGQTNYWTGEQLRHIAREIEPPEWTKDRPINLESNHV